MRLTALSVCYLCLNHAVFAQDQKKNSGTNAWLTCALGSGLNIQAAVSRNKLYYGFDYLFWQDHFFNGNRVYSYGPVVGAFLSPASNKFVVSAGTGIGYVVYSPAVPGGGNGVILNPGAGRRPGKRTGLGWLVEFETTWRLSKYFALGLKAEANANDEKPVGVLMFSLKAGKLF
ncbi:MAG: hypothetical protein KIT62_03805 [Cyclobacteriaceae bacterium]|nr:hypothetical protein [Cyclobacteriaceae bacterium]